MEEVCDKLFMQQHDIDQKTAVADAHLALLFLLFLLPFFCLLPLKPCFGLELLS